MPLAISMHFSMNLSQIDSWTKVLEPAMQLCPQFPKRMQAWLAAISRSASGQMMLADFPPSSRVMGFRFSLCEFLMMIQPTSVDPVKEILSIPLCWAMAAPVSPHPGRMLITPGGNPASLMRLPSMSAVKGVCSAGLMTMVHPAASAGAIFQVSIKRGQFHGMICPTTPIGYLMVMPMKGWVICRVFPFTLSVMPAKCLKTDTEAGMSSLMELEMGLPLLRVSKQASHQVLASMRSANLLMCLPRLAASQFLQTELNASLALATARSTSSGVAAMARPMTYSVAGLKTSKDLPLDSIYSPFMNNFPATSVNFSANFISTTKYLIYNSREVKLGLEAKRQAYISIIIKGRGGG